MARSLINGELEKLRTHIENVKMSEEKKYKFFQSEWNRICEKERKITKEYYQLSGIH